MPGCVCERAILAPARHATVDERGVAGGDIGRPEAEAFCDAGAEALDEELGVGDEVENAGDIGRVFEVGLKGFLSAVQHAMRDDVRRVAGAHDTDDARAHVCENHRGERAGANPAEVDNGDAGEGAHRDLPS